MGMLATFVSTLTAPLRDFQYAIQRVKSMLLSPFQRLFRTQTDMSNDLRQMGSNFRPPPPPKP
jgi:hypothetical protein